MRINEIIVESELDEGWKQKAAAAALGGAMALGAGGAKAMDWKDAAMTGASFLPGIGQAVAAYNVGKGMYQAGNAVKAYNDAENTYQASLAKHKQQPTQQAAVTYDPNYDSSDMEPVDEEMIDEYSHMDKSIYDALKKKGYKYLGSGVDQSAFTEPGTGYVLKIFGTDRNDQFSHDHKMFFKWYDFCTKNQKNKFLPRFYGHESFLWKDKNYKGKPHRYLMIRTEPLRESGVVGRAAAKLADLAAQHNGNTTRVLASFESYYKEQTKTLYAALGNNMGDIYRLADTMGKLFKMGEKNEWGWDLHYGNIMLRADGTPIINDPWVV